MNLVKLGKKGQVSIPQAVLRQLGLTPDVPLLVETTADGAIVLRQVSVHPIEIYSDERLAEFERENELTPEQAARYGPQLADFSGWLRTQAQRKRAAPRSSAGAKAPRAARR
jgi:bifunctional DNA-binding transcriptional regulator/antitoxin component of YhaV-PrlF toxin-antitoxin module